MLFSFFYFFALNCGVSSAFKNLNNKCVKISIFRKNVIVQASVSEVELSLGELIDCNVFIERFAKNKVTGVYAINNYANQVQYIGISKDVTSAVQVLLNKVGIEEVNSVRVQTFSIPSISAMEAYKMELIRQLGLASVLEVNKEWESILTNSGKELKSSNIISFESTVDENSVSNSEKKETSRKSLKDLLRETRQQQQEEQSNIISPFNIDTADVTTEKESIVRSTPMVGLGGGLEFNKENIDKVLEEVRPYLIADGGNVAIASIDEENRSISLILQGACGSCPSSTTTMKMGIERVLRENFANLGEIVAINPTETELVSNLTTDMVEEALKPVMSAITAMGGKVELTEVDSSTGLVRLKYQGPTKLRQGVELILKDLKYVKNIEIQNF